MLSGSRSWRRRVLSSTLSLKVSNGNLPSNTKMILGPGFIPPTQLLLFLSHHLHILHAPMLIALFSCVRHDASNYILYCYSVSPMPQHKKRRILNVAFGIHKEYFKNQKRSHCTVVKIVKYKDFKK
ncbi:unnamed protein product [Sphenostylis stenocarpa]|uniref:Uncharacterized protein n=1 Tax=Sphenostylis stenocarpa TaxID=92480 RepID=A0AA86S0R6_9FABA|nr:unnamed protein product [Sphenostylis stenocarpa]